jgi:hypothetical protein
MGTERQERSAHRIMPIGTQSASRRPRWLAAHGKTLHRAPSRIRNATPLRGRCRGVKIPMGTLVSMKAVFRPEYKEETWRSTKCGAARGSDKGRIDGSHSASAQPTRRGRVSSLTGFWTAQSFSFLPAMAVSADFRTQDENPADLLPYPQLRLWS